MQNRYFREELDWLRQQGREFSDANPSLTRFLSDQGSDPDVERLLEGFAFLTSRIRDKVEDEFPELTHALTNILWPNYLRPVPAMAIVQFDPIWHALNGSHHINKGVELASKSIDGVECRFRTSRSLTVYPLRQTGVKHTQGLDGATIDLMLEVAAGQVFKARDLENLPVYLGGDGFAGRTLLLWFNHYLSSVDVFIGSEVFRLPNSVIEATGFDQQDALLPYPENAHQGLRIIQEYLAFSDAFHFIALKNISQYLPNANASRITFRFNFSRRLPESLTIRPEHLSINCLPVVNLFSHDADPIDLQGERSEYRIRPSGRKPKCFEIFSVDQVSGIREGAIGEGGLLKREYRAFESFEFSSPADDGEELLFYKVRLKECIQGNGFDHDISFIRGGEHNYLTSREVISLELTCTNRDLPDRIDVGDICVPTESSPACTQFKNITKPTPACRPAIDGELLWGLISNLSLNYLSLLDRDSLCTLLRDYDFRAMVDRQAYRVSEKRLQGILGVESSHIDALYKGVPVRGFRTTLHLDQDAFGDEGAVYLFGSVMAHFFQLFVRINSFHDLHVINSSNKERYEWNMMKGQKVFI